MPVAAIQLPQIEEREKINGLGHKVIDILGYQNQAEAIRNHCKGALNQGIPTNSGVQSMSIIPERDVYRLIMRSFDWVLILVLPFFKG